MPKPPAAKPKRTRKPKNTCTALMVVPAQTAQLSKRPSPSARIQTRMNQFIRAYEKLHGNILATCEATGISRRSYYRWLEGTKSIHKQFQARIKRLPVGEVRLDLAEYTIDRAMEAGQTIPAYYVLNNLGQSRGYNRPQQATLDPDAIQKLLDAFQIILRDNPDMSDSERAMWIKDFAASGGVPEDALARRVKVLELTGANK